MLSEPLLIMPASLTNQPPFKNKLNTPAEAIFINYAIVISENNYWLQPRIN
jgi:hypothetical protein